MVGRLFYTDGANLGEVVVRNLEEPHRWLNHWSFLTFRIRPHWKKTIILTHSINTMGCLHGVLSSVSHCRQTVSAFQQFLSVLSEKSACGYRLSQFQPWPRMNKHGSEMTQNNKPNSAYFHLLTRNCWDNINHEPKTCSVLGVAWNKVAWGNYLYLICKNKAVVFFLLSL